VGKHEPEENECQNCWDLEDTRHFVLDTTNLRSVPESGMGQASLQEDEAAADA